MRSSLKVRPMNTERIQKEAWLQAALDYVLENGVFGMTPARLAESLGTSRSSFYWHFGSMREFREHVVDYWIETYTHNVAAEMTRMDGGPAERFRFLLDRINNSGINKYEGAVHALAYGSAPLLQKIQNAYQRRLNITRNSLREAGAEEGKAEALARIILCFLTWRAAMGYPETADATNMQDQLVLFMIGSSHT